MPIEYAPTFDRNFGQLVFQNPKYAVEHGDALRLESVEILDPTSGRRYGLGTDRDKLSTSDYEGLESCDTIHFESIPVGSIDDGLLIHEQFLDAYGVAFELHPKAVVGPRLAKVGPPVSAFNGHLGPDMPNDSDQTGDYFLTDDGSHEGVKASALLVVTFASPARRVGGLLIDIDPEDEVVIEAYDGNDNLLELQSLRGTDPFTGNGVATPWSIAVDDNRISRIDIVPRPQRYLGIAYDNFVICRLNRR